jgi:hypothetical protein
MTAPFTTYLIDPFACTITEVQYSGHYQDIYKHIDAECYDCARLNVEGDGLFVDDEGMFKEGTMFFYHEDYPHPLAGKALMLGCNMETGETQAPYTTLDELTRKVRFVMPLRINGDLVWMDNEGELVELDHEA